MSCVTLATLPARATKVQPKATMGGFKGLPIARPRPASVFNRAPALAPQRVNNRSAMTVRALALPALVPILARAFTAGVLFYASMNWVFFRGTRKDAEKYMKEHEGKEGDRLKKLEKLNGKKRDNKN